MRSTWLLILLLTLCAIFYLVHGDHPCPSNRTNVWGQRSARILSRRRRLIFPKGSTFVMTLSMLQAIPVHLPSNWNLDFEFDVIWPIPIQENFEKKRKRKKTTVVYVRKPWMVKRRHRRELYATFEAALNSRNIPGRSCILRMICEARTMLSPPGESFVEDAVRLILKNVDTDDDIDSYDVAYRTKEPCDASYTCPVSLLSLLLYNLYPDGLG